MLPLRDALTIAHNKKSPFISGLFKGSSFARAVSVSGIRFPRVTLRAIVEVSREEAALLYSLLRVEPVPIHAVRSPFGPPPRAPWKRQTVQPVTAGAMHGRLVRFEVAEQRGLFWNG